MKSPTKTTKPHTVVVSGDDKGGVTKSCSLAAVADALLALGYTLRLADGDTANRTLAVMMPQATRIDGRNQAALNDYIGQSATATEDVTLIDMPGSSGSILADYFSATGFSTFEEMGIRVVVALTLTQTPDSVRGARSWIKAFMDSAKFIIFANHRDTPTGEPFDLGQIPGGKLVAELAGDRLIDIPAWSPYMVAQFVGCQASPRSYMQGGEAARKLKLNPLSSAPWRTHHNRVTASTAKIAEWLTGKPLPTAAPEIAQDAMSAEKAALLEKLSQEIGD